MYGHKEGAVAITVSLDELSPIIHEGRKVVELQLGGHSQTTIFREVQFNTFGTEILHFDLLRVDPEERRVSEVPIEYRGISPGVVAGGILDQHLHSLQMEVKTLELPDSIRIRINDLKIGDAVRIKDLDLPPSATIDLPEDTVVVQVIEPTVAPEEPTDAEAVPSEPEVIGQSSSDDES